MNKTTWESTVKPIVVLSVISLVVSLLLAVVNSMTAPVIAENERATTLAAYVDVMPSVSDASTLEEMSGYTTANVSGAVKAEDGSMAIKDNPSNVDLWFGRGRIFYALKDYDQSIESFKKVVELKPDLFEGNYYLGVFYTIKGDALNKEMNEKQYSSQAVYDADLKVVNDVYKDAVPWFEKAHQIKPDDVDTLEFLKSICFRLRDEAGIMEKYNTYNALYKQVKGIE